jgi:hypothetical protein
MEDFSEGGMLVANGSLKARQKTPFELTGPSFHNAGVAREHCRCAAVRSEDQPRMATERSPPPDMASWCAAAETTGSHEPGLLDQLRGLLVVAELGHRQTRRRDGAEWSQRGVGRYPGSRGVLEVVAAGDDLLGGGADEKP